MHAAAAMGRDSMFDLLLSLPECGLNTRDDAGNTPLYYAARGFFDVDRAVSFGKARIITQRASTAKARARSIAKAFSMVKAGNIVNASTIANLVNRGADIQATNKYGESPMVFALSKTGCQQWKAALQLLDLEPASFVPSNMLIATALARASEDPQTQETAFFSRVLTPATLNHPYRVPGTPLNIGFFQNWHNKAGKSSTPLMWFIVQRCSTYLLRCKVRHMRLRVCLWSS